MPRCARDTRPRARIANAAAPLPTWQLVKQSGADQKQRDLVRVPSDQACYVDQALREIAARLMLRRRPDLILPGVRLDPSNVDQVVSWSKVATYLAGRIQAHEYERPGRQPDMSPDAAAAMRTVLQDMWWASFEILRKKKMKGLPWEMTLNIR